MNKDFLLELGLEEIPAKFAPGAVTQIEKNAQKLLAELRLAYKDLRAYITPRRLALYIEGLAEKQEDINEEAKGPAQKAAFDKDGKPTKAAEGFARGQGVKTDELFIKEFNGVPYVYARKSLQGKQTESLLPQFCLDLVSSLHFPKPMRWGDCEIRFIRPIRWLVALYGEQIIPFNYVGLQAGRTTRGHRTLGGYVRLLKPEDYLEGLEKAYVIADQEKRKQTIWKQVQMLATKAKAVVYEDDLLLTEICHLVEYPTALIGEIDVKYLTLPEEVIVTPMKEHQRYFPVRDEEGKLLPYFITVRNGDSTSIAKVKEGNKKVLKARLEDAAFYYREDLKKPLHTLVPQLERVVYHEKLGTVGQRVKRLQELSAMIAKEMAVDENQKALVERTAYLAKADLITNMVYDFPELQGIMGSYYAQSNGEAQEVCVGILEHYRPRFAGDVFPESVTGKIVSMADRLDAIVGSFGIGIQPTGSQDPYALRRQAMGIVGMMMEDRRDISLNKLIADSYKTFQEQGIPLEPLNEIQTLLEDFFQQRIKYLLQEMGWRYDTIDAVLIQGGQNPYTVKQKVECLSKCRERADFTAYINAAVRCLNLSKKSAEKAWMLTDLIDSTEIELANALQAKEPLINEAISKADYCQAYILAAELVPLIERLFDAVMIMDENEKVRNARLGLLRDCARLLNCLGDLSVLA